MIALAIVLAVLVVLMLLPVGARVTYDDGEALLELAAGPVRFTLWPRPPADPEKAAKRREKRESKKKKADKPREKKAEPMKLSFQDIRPMIHPALELVGSLPRKLLVRELTLHATYGAKDAASAAIGYGRAWAFIGGIMPVLENAFRIQKRDVGAELDYERTTLGVFARLDIRMRIGTGILLGLKAGWMLLKVYFETKKGGADQ